MTSKQEAKLKSIKGVLNHYENTRGTLIIEAKYSKSYFCRMFIGKRGGFNSPTIIYKNYDFLDKKPYHRLFEEN